MTTIIITTTTTTTTVPQPLALAVALATVQRPNAFLCPMHELSANLCAFVQIWAFLGIKNCVHSRLQVTIHVCVIMPLCIGLHMGAYGFIFLPIGYVLCS